MGDRLVRHARKDGFLKTHEIRVLRISDEDVFQEMNAVVLTIPAEHEG